MEQLEQLRTEVRDELKKLIREEVAASGVADGAWLLDIETARESLRRTDDLLRRLEQTIVRAQERAFMTLESVEVENGRDDPARRA